MTYEEIGGNVCTFNAPVKKIEVKVRGIQKVVVVRTRKNKDIL